MPTFGACDERHRAFWAGVDLARCGGCGELIRAGERVYDDYDPGRGPEIVARCHSESLACLIVWNERWHAAAGHEYDAALYCQHLNDEGRRFLERIRSKFSWLS